MRCAIECITYLYKLWNVDTTKIIVALEDKMTASGISIYDLVYCLKEDNNKVKAYYSFLLPRDENVILYLNRFHVAHYIILRKKSFFYVWIYDSLLKECKIAKWRIYFLYSKKYILCYNNKKR